jgi:hypothetical protein
MASVLALGLLTITLTGCVDETLRPLNVATPPPPEISRSQDGSYTGWWTKDSLPGQPADVVLFNTNSRSIVGVFDHGTPQRGTSFRVPTPTAWPKSAVIVFDAQSSAVADSFPIDPAGNPVPRPAQNQAG